MTNAPKLLSGFLPHSLQHVLDVVPHFNVDPRDRTAGLCSDGSPRDNSLRCIRMFGRHIEGTLGDIAGKPPDEENSLQLLKFNLELTSSPIPQQTIVHECKAASTEGQDRRRHRQFPRERLGGLNEHDFDQPRKEMRRFDSALSNPATGRKEAITPSGVECGRSTAHQCVPNPKFLAVSQVFPKLVQQLISSDRIEGSNVHLDQCQTRPPLHLRLHKAIHSMNIVSRLPMGTGTLPGPSKPNLIFASLQRHTAKQPLGSRTDRYRPCFARGDRSSLGNKTIAL